MPDCIPQAGEGWPECDVSDVEPGSYDPRTRKQRHDDHYSRLVANRPDMERWVVLDENQKAVSGVHPRKRYEIVRGYGRIENWNPDGSPSAMSLERAEYGKPWVRGFVSVELLHKTPEAAVEFLRSMQSYAVAAMEAQINSVRADINSLNSAIDAAMSAQQAQTAQEGGEK